MVACFWIFGLILATFRTICVSKQRRMGVGWAIIHGAQGIGQLLHTCAVVAIVVVNLRNVYAEIKMKLGGLLLAKG